MEAKAEAVDNLRAVLLWFDAVANLSINVHKTKMYSVNASHEFEDEMADWGCQWGELLTTYRGLPLAAGYKLRSVWKPVVDRFRQRLATWERN